MRAKRVSYGAISSGFEPVLQSLGVSHLGAHHAIGTSYSMYQYFW